MHVWQYQNLGSRYATDALGAQQYYGGGALAYDWTLEFARGNTTWLQFNKEANAAFMEDVWVEGAWTDSTGTLHNGMGGFFEFDPAIANPGTASFIATKDGMDHTPFAVSSIAIMRSHFNARLSRLLQ